MSKSKKAPKKVKKAVKPASAKKAPKKAKAKPVKKSAKPAKKAASKKSKPVKKVVKAAAKKKPVAKKIAPKTSSKPSKKTVKPVKKSVKPVKAIKKAEPLKKTAAKLAKKDPKAAAPLKKSGKIEVIIVKGKKGAKPEKPAKAAKPGKAEKGKAGKKRSGDDDLLLDADVKPSKGPKSRAGRKPKSKNDDDEPEIVHDELIEQLIQSTRKKKQGPKVPKLIKTFVNPIASLSIPEDELDKKSPRKEAKGKFELEYVIRTSAGILYELISTPSGLSEWFADDVNIRDGYFTFFWDGSEQRAKLLGFKEEKYIRLRWVDKPEGTYFEFRIERDELTGDISLIITDFADELSDQQTSKLLWDSQVNKLLGVLGSI
ncbi:MAG: START-like domain-containing protein [Bacteroidia bacterium]